MGDSSKSWVLSDEFLERLQQFFVSESIGVLGARVQHVEQRE
jgi:hypothetical protein